MFDPLGWGWRDGYRLTRVHDGLLFSVCRFRLNVSMPSVTVNGCSCGPFDALFRGAEGFGGMCGGLEDVVTGLESQLVLDFQKLPEGRLEVSAPPDDSDPKWAVRWRGYLRCFDMLVATGTTCTPVHPDNCGIGGPRRSVLGTMPPERSRVQSERQLQAGNPIAYPPPPSMLIRGLCDLAKIMPDYFVNYRDDLAGIPQDLLSRMQNEAVGGEFVLTSATTVPVYMDEKVERMAPFGSLRKGRFQDMDANRPETYFSLAYLFMYAFADGPLTSTMCSLGRCMINSFRDSDDDNTLLSSCMGGVGGYEVEEDVLFAIKRLADDSKKPLPAELWEFMLALLAVYGSEEYGQTHLKTLGVVKWLIQKGAPPSTVRLAAVMSCSEEERANGQVYCPADAPPAARVYIFKACGPFSGVPKEALNVQFCPAASFFPKGTKAFGTPNTSLFPTEAIQSYYTAILAFLRHRNLQAVGAKSPVVHGDDLPMGYAVGLPVELVASIFDFIMLH
jgi:hypothetical protein